MSHDDVDCMVIGTGMSVMAAGLRGSMQAATLRDLLDTTGLLDPDMRRALDAVEVQGRKITAAGATSIGHDMVGTLLDSWA